MKTNNGVIPEPLNQDELTELMKQTPETVAKDMLKNKKNKNSFGLVDLWRMQKKHKTLGSSTRW